MRSAQKARSSPSSGPARGDLVGEALPFDVFEDDERVVLLEFGVEHARNGRVTDRHQGPHLAPQTLRRHLVVLGIDALERGNHTLGVAHEVHLSRAARRRVGAPPRSRPLVPAAEVFGRPWRHVTAGSRTGGPGLGLTS